MVKRKQKKVKYFYLDNKLHKVLSINRPQDLVVSWCYPDSKRITYVWSDARRRLGKAYTLAQVCELINRHRVNVERYITSGAIRTPQRSYTLDENRRPGKYFFSEKDVLELHDYLITVHRGRPRKDGAITPSGIPSKAELRAMMHRETATYIKNEEGEFIQVWKENDW